VLGLLNEAIFDPGFNVANSVFIWTGSRWGECRIVGRENGREGNDDVEVNVGKSAPQLNSTAGPSVSVSSLVPSDVAKV